LPVPPAWGKVRFGGFFDAGHVTLNHERYTGDVSNATGRNEYWWQRGDHHCGKRHDRAPDEPEARGKLEHFQHLGPEASVTSWRGSLTIPSRKISWHTMFLPEFRR